VFYNTIRIQIAVTAKIFKGEIMFYYNLNVFGRNIGALFRDNKLANYNKLTAKFEMSIYHKTQ